MFYKVQILIRAQNTETVYINYTKSLYRLLKYILKIIITKQKCIHMKNIEQINVFIKEKQTKLAYN